MQGSFARFILKYGTRSLRRNPRRTTLTVLTVAGSVIFTVVGSRFGVAMMSLWVNGAADTGMGHSQVHAKGYWQDAEGVKRSLTMPNDSPSETLLREDKDVQAMSRRLKVEGIVSSRDKTIYFIGIGVDPDSEMAVSPKLFSPQNDRGSFVPFDKIEGVTIGNGLAQALNVDVGDEISLISPTIEGSVNAVDVQVAGVVNIPLPTFSKRIIYLNNQMAQKLLRMPDRYNELVVRLKEGVIAEEWVKKYRDNVNQNGHELRGWWEVDPIIKDVEGIFYGTLAIVSILLFFSAGLSVLNMIFMMVAERTVEIGTLMALGARPLDIGKMFAGEAALIGAMGGGIGGVVGNIVVIIMGAAGVPFKNPFSSGTIDVYPTINVADTALIAFGAVIICIVAAILPARKASMVEPVQAFRGQIV
jgi:putative ABC transport system permease protein